MWGGGGGDGVYSIAQGRVESIQKRFHSMADTAIIGRNSCMVHSTAACKVTYMSVSFSAVSVHCCEVLPYGPLYSCLPTV